MSNYFGSETEKIITNGVFMTFCRDDKVDWIVAVPGNQSMDTNVDFAFHYLVLSLKNKEVKRIFIWPGSHISIYYDHVAAYGEVIEINSEKEYFIFRMGDRKEKIDPHAVEILSIGTDQSDERPEKYR